MTRLVYIAAILSVTIYFIAGCKEEPPKKVRRGSYHTQEFLDSRIVITEDGMTNAIVEAHKVYVFEEQNYTVIDENIAIDFFNKNGEAVSRLTANSGEVWGLYENVDSLKAAGNVVITSTEREWMLETPYNIRWIAATKRVYADSTVKLSTEGAVEIGVGFEAPDDLSSYKMREVKGEYQNRDVVVPERE